MTLSRKLLIAMVCIIFFVSFVVGIAAFQLAGDVVHQFEENIVELNAKNSTEHLQNVFENARDVLVQMVEHTSVYQILENEYQTEAQYAEQTNLLRAKLNDFFSLSAMAGNEMFSFINIYLKNGISVETSGKDDLAYSDYNGICDYLEQQNIWSQSEYQSIVWFNVTKVRNVNGIKEDCYLCVRFLYDRITMQRVGAIVAGISTADLKQCYGMGFPEAMIISSFGDVISSGTNMNGITHVPEDMKATLNQVGKSNVRISYALNGEESQALCWRVANNCAYFLIPVDSTNIMKGESLKNFISQLVIITFIAALLASIISVLCVRTLTNGLKKLKSVVQKVAIGERDARFVPKKRDEIAFVGLQFNNMLDELENYYDELQQKEGEKKNLELSLLQSKINPHLLYNTLDIAIWAIKRSDPHKAEQVIYALSSFFKRSLAKGREVNTLKSELELCQSYVELQCLVGNKDYHFDVIIDPELIHQELLHMIFQPIVENCIAHGFLAFRDDGTIRITAEQDKLRKRIYFHIWDNGLGIAPDQLERINRSLSVDLYAENDSHYGLRNVVRRIKNHYGDAFGIKIVSEMGEFTEVIISIPLFSPEERGEGVV